MPGQTTARNSRRRTISKPSSAVAGRHEDSTRPTTLRSRSSASRPRLAAHFHIIGLRVRRASGVRCRKADHQQAVLRELRRFGQYLGEGELRLEAACRQIALVVELPRIGHPFVDQDQARSILDEQLAQHIAGAGRLLVVSLRHEQRPSCRRAAKPVHPTACAPLCHRAWWKGCRAKSCCPPARRAVPLAASVAPASCITASMPASSVGEMPENR